MPAWLTVPQEWVEWTLTSISGKKVVSRMGDLIRVPNKAEPSSLPVTNYISSPGIRRSFCSKCGTNLAFVDLERDMGGGGDVAKVDIVLGSLDRESLEVEGVWPRRHEYWDSGVEWIKKLVTEGDGALAGGGSGSGNGRVPRHPEGEWDVVV